VFSRSSQDRPRGRAEAMGGELRKPCTRHIKGDRKRRGRGGGISGGRAPAARGGRTPATGEQIQIKASKKIAFRPAKELKEAI